MHFASLPQYVYRNGNVIWLIDSLSLLKIELRKVNRRNDSLPNYAVNSSLPNPVPSSFEKSINGKKDICRGTSSIPDTKLVRRVFQLNPVLPKPARNCSASSWTGVELITSAVFPHVISRRCSGGCLECSRRVTSESLCPWCMRSFETLPPRDSLSPRIALERDPNPPRPVPPCFLLSLPFVIPVHAYVGSCLMRKSCCEALPTFCNIVVTYDQPYHADAHYPGPITYVGNYQWFSRNFPRKPNTDVELP